MNVFEQPSPDKAVFNFSVDDTAKAYLLETARWAKFLAIVGFVCLGLLVLLGVFMSTILGSLGSRYESVPGLGGIMIVMYVVLAILYFFPTYYIYRFATLIKPALQTENREEFNQALSHLRNAFRFIGVFTLVILGFYALAILIGIIAGAMG